jgi:hypothetical protein
MDVAVKPSSEPEPFFRMNHEEFVNKTINKRPRGDLNPYLQYLDNGLYPIILLFPFSTKNKLPHLI